MIKYSSKNKILLLIKITFIYLFIYSTFASAEDSKIKEITEGEVNAKVEILVYESLSCSHCATFHKEIYPDLKKNFIDKGLVIIKFKNFPLDMVALNASKIAHCKNDGNSDILHFLYYNQNIWMKGGTVDEVTLSLKNFINKENFGINFSNCISDKRIEDHILEDRVESVKKFKINSTPTLIINNKKFDKPINYKNLKKTLEKLI